MSIKRKPTLVSVIEHHNQLIEQSVGKGYTISKACVSDKLLPILSNQKVNAYLKEIANVCGIKKEITFHVARHTFATTVTLSNGVPIESVSKMLGHKKLQTTQLYAKVLDCKVSEDMKALNERIRHLDK